MDNFLSEYNKMCKNNFSGYGFKRLGNNHWRIKNDLCQSFVLNRARGGGACSILFGGEAMCSPNIPIFIRYGGLFPTNSFEGYDRFQWVYDSTSISSIQNCIDEIFHFIQSDLVAMSRQKIKNF
jgi:hypothetical protein